MRQLVTAGRTAMISVERTEALAQVRIRWDRRVCRSRELQRQRSPLSLPHILDPQITMHRSRAAIAGFTVVALPIGRTIDRRRVWRTGSNIVRRASEDETQEETTF